MQGFRLTWPGTQPAGSDKPPPTPGERPPGTKQSIGIPETRPTMSVCGDVAGHTGVKGVGSTRAGSAPFATVGWRLMPARLQACGAWAIAVACLL